MTTEVRYDWPAVGVLPFEAFREAGLLWLVNRVVFHPRGYALAFEFDNSEEPPSHGKCTGWKLIGDGTEPWSMGDPPAGSGYPTEDELFARTKALLA